MQRPMSQGQYEKGQNHKVSLWKSMSPGYNAKSMSKGKHMKVIFTWSVGKGQSHKVSLWKANYQIIMQKSMS